MMVEMQSAVTLPELLAECLIQVAATRNSCTALLGKLDQPLMLAF